MHSHIRLIVNILESVNLAGIYRSLQKEKDPGGKPCQVPLVKLVARPPGQKHPCKTLRPQQFPPLSPLTGEAWPMKSQEVVTFLVGIMLWGRKLCVEPNVRNCLPALIPFHVYPNDESQVCFTLFPLLTSNENVGSQQKRQLCIMLPVSGNCEQ